MAFGLATEDDDGAKLGQDKNEKVSKAQLNVLKKMLSDERIEKMLKHYKVEKLEDLTAEQYADILDILKKESKN